jgi:hypothetical protein
MTELSRRGFIAAATAMALAPLPKEAPHHFRVEALRGDRFTVEPNGLRGVRNGERFRMLNPTTLALCMEATAREDGHTGTDRHGARGRPYRHGPRRHAVRRGRGARLRPFRRARSRGVRLPGRGRHGGGRVTNFTSDTRPLGTHQSKYRPPLCGHPPPKPAKMPKINGDTVFYACTGPCGVVTALASICWLDDKPVCKACLQTARDSVVDMTNLGAVCECGAALARHAMDKPHGLPGQCKYFKARKTSPEDVCRCTHRRLNHASSGESSVRADALHPRRIRRSVP